MNEWTMIDAVNRAMANQMRVNDNIVVLGEDIGANGGVFRATDKLQKEFGSKRVFDTPLAESAIVGMSIGMASQGLIPIVEIQFMGFIYSAIDQILNHAARLRNRTRGRLSCPMVIRAPFGGGIHAPEHHCESTEALFAHIPGLRVVIPSSPARAYGLLIAAIQDPDPLLFLEPKRIYRDGKQAIKDNGQPLPLDTCFVLREGIDLTLISWGAMLKETLAAAEQLTQQGIDAEVIDVATIKPLDISSIIDSVNKTGRCIIIHEAAKTGGVGAEIAAQLAEKSITSLLAPVQRVTGYDTVMPMLKNEHYYMPSAQRIINSAIQIMEYR
ncbi:MAG: pyruvate dehydrogenase E1 component beta subunit [Cycloclasticus pugetii]|jgi:pyruvate dehydrogenase E1 component beta subunit|uniref:alpha-ketoacid dehydrogenase subunit beta n=1 Tax=Cycloclasticus pugetii TaxID=34068 RepID=UPI0003806312|nr:alpha-ketoacid dehydrogenase subunit beta [Cycloclasticus pugetii]